MHTSASASDDFYTSDIKVSANFSLYAAPELLSPYSDLPIIIYIPFSVPNSVSASVQSFSLRFELWYALPIRHANISKSFKDAGRNSIPILSMETTLEYVVYDGGALVRPSATNLAFILNFIYILISNIMCTLTF